MGGHAYVIPGRLAPERLAEAQRPAEPAAVPFWRRLIGSSTLAESRAVDLPNGDRLVTIPPAPLDTVLIRDLRGWLDSQILQPSRGTAVVLEYLSDIAPAVYVRGLQRVGTDAPEYYVQVTFSGCAGEAEVSARVASHWTAAWYAKEYDRITAEHLTPYGFLPASQRSEDDEPMVFLPAGELGYLEYIPPAMREEGQSAFDLDNGIVEANEGNPLLTRLDDVFSGFVRDAACRCQLCDPEFGDATIDEGPGQ